MLFIGVGGAAGQVLGRLRRRLEERFLFPDRIPAWRTLMIDTDADALASLGKNESAESAVTADTLLLPLRTTQEYRDASPQLLKWLSRRWLYNIARVPRVSGWRPLGRLALIDNCAPLTERLRKMIQEFATDEALASSTEVTGACFSARPAIVLVSSISGGTGSGMVLDLAYLVRKLAAELNLGAFDLRGILLHATDQDSDARDLARANTFACLTELAHFNRPGCGYPGDTALQVPAFPSVVPTFDETYVVHLGDDLGHADYLDQLERVSDFLYYGAATKASTLLESARVADAAGAPAGPLDQQVRTFGMYAVNNLRREDVDDLVNRACQAVAAQWLGPATSSGNLTSSRRREAAGDGPSAALQELIDQALGPGADKDFANELKRSLESALSSAPAGNRSASEPGAPVQRGDTLAAIGADLCDLVSSLAALRRDTASPSEPDAAHGTSHTKLPLDSIRATVKSFLDARATELAQSLTGDFPRMFFRREHRAGAANEPSGQPLNRFCRQLRITVRAGIMQALKQVDVSRLLLEMAGKSRAAREPMRELIAAANPRLTAPQGAERLFVFAPSYADRGVLGRFFSEDLQEEATVAQTEDDRLTLFCERAQLRLHEVAASLIDEDFHFAEVAARLHTRIDVHWTPLPRPSEKSLV
jgi:hypothetical protein